MVREEQIMGLCDEMTIAKKVETFVAMMQGLLDSFDMDTWRRIWSKWMAETWIGALQPLLVSMCAQNRLEVNLPLAILKQDTENVWEQIYLYVYWPRSTFESLLVYHFFYTLFDPINGFSTHYCCSRKTTMYETQNSWSMSCRWCRLPFLFYSQLREHN